MRVLLMDQDRDFDDQATPPWNDQALIQDLELETLFAAMAGEDRFVLDVVKKAILAGTPGPDTILYRQNILRDCLKNRQVVKDLYNLAVEAIEGERKSYFGIFSKYPGSLLNGAINILTVYVHMLRRLRGIAETHGKRFQSAGFTNLFHTLEKELAEDYLNQVQAHLHQLKFPHGVLISAGLGKGNKGVDHTLHEFRKPGGWLRKFIPKKEPGYVYRLADRDDSGARALAQIRDQGINLAANALARSVDHIRGFFVLLRTELAFYIGATNLHEQLAGMEYPTCFPVPARCHERGHSFSGLFDVCLALTMNEKAVGSDLNLDGKSLIIVTGANQGGKSTFLRSIGLAQLMMQCGMFVPAASFQANCCSRLFTHFRREEDSTMESGKLDEELRRMSKIVDHTTPDALLLCNESFMATNEREGSEIGRQIISALLEAGIKIFFVTHLYDFARGFAEQQGREVVFLRAQRNPDGGRTFRMIEAEPKPTSYGKDLYQQVFGADGGPG